MNAFPMLLGLACISHPFGTLEDQPTDEGAARRAIEAHYTAGADPKTVLESSELYAEDAVLEFPQGGERIRGKANIVAFRTAYPARVDFDFGEPWTPPAWRAQWVEPIQSECR